DLGVLEIDGRDVYPQTQEYARTMFLVRAPGNNSYAVDIFRVRGGHDHLLSFHGPPGLVANDGLQLEDQTTGTYAGEDVKFAEQRPGDPLGYCYLYDVQRDASPPSQFTLDWKLEPGYREATKRDNVHLRAHFLTQCNDVALADADPPQNKPFNPR